MVSAETLRNWGSPEDLFTISDVSSQGADSWTARLHAAAAALPEDMELTVSKASGDERIWLVFRSALPPDIARMPASREPSESIGAHLRMVENARGAMLRCLLAQEGGAQLIEIRTAIYTDGSSRNTLNEAVSETIKAYLGVLQGYEGLRATARIADQTREWLKTEEARMTQTFAPPPRPDQSLPQNRSVALQQIQQPASNPVACRGCGASNASGSRFCSQCGTKLL